MSRSYKKNPGWKCKTKDPSFWKRQASKAVRNSEITDDGSAYKKLYERSMIWDWNFRAYSKRDLLDKWGYSSNEEGYRYWIK